MACAPQRLSRGFALTHRGTYLLCSGLRPIPVRRVATGRQEPWDIPGDKSKCQYEEGTDVQEDERRGPGPSGRGDGGPCSTQPVMGGAQQPEAPTLWLQK